MIAHGNGSEIGSILAYADGGPGSEAVIKTAMKIGQIYSSHVEVLHIAKSVDSVLLPVDIGGSLVASTEIFEIMRKESEERANKAKSVLEEFCKIENIEKVAPDSDDTLSHQKLTLSWNLLAGNDGRDLAHRGRLFDLIVMARATDQIGGVDSIQLEAALFDSGRPVLVAGEQLDEPRGTAAVIAWDGSREAAHSVTLALPLLSKASQVHLMSVGKREPGLDIVDFGRYLARRGILVEHCQLPPSDESIANALVNASLEKKAGMLVMGAYGHSALGESLFGGVTREMLEGGKIPLLMAH